MDSSGYQKIEGDEDNADLLYRKLRSHFGSSV
jgi:hypothetical protein